MKFFRTLLIAGIAWLIVITPLHGGHNLHMFEHKKPGGAPRFRVGFLPFTCSPTCPVTDFIIRSTTGDNIFDPLPFNGWPELKEAFLAGQTPARFILAPMATALREQGIPLKIVHLGYRDGTAVCVQKVSNIHSMQDLRAKRTAVPDFSSHFPESNNPRFRSDNEGFHIKAALRLETNPVENKKI